jgi:hypothetical protein
MPDGDLDHVVPKPVAQFRARLPEGTLVSSTALDQGMQRVDISPPNLMALQ